VLSGYNLTNVFNSLSSTYMYLYSILVGIIIFSYVNFYTYTTNYTYRYISSATLLVTSLVVILGVLESASVTVVPIYVATLKALVYDSISPIIVHVTLTATRYSFI